MCALQRGPLPNPASLDEEVATFQSLCFSDNTKRAYSAHLKAYLRFCHALGVPPTPVSSKNLCRYVAYLARRLCYNSIKQYLNIIRILHQQRGFSNPLEGDFLLTTTLRGVRRHLGDRVHRKVPVTPRLLLLLLRGLNLSQPRDANIWAAALLMFFGLLRRSHVLVNSLKDFDTTKHLRRQDLCFDNKGLQVRVRWSKTNQFRTTETVIPYPRVRDHPLCPTQAVFHAVSLSPSAPKDGPALVLPGGGHPPVPPQTFVNRVRTILSDHVQDPVEVGGHSFRRGGACWALSQQVPVDTIRQLGNWVSNSYTAYILEDVEGLRKATESMTVHLPTTT